MSATKSIKIYLRLIDRAWQTTLAQKEWWPLAALAGVLYTGAVFNTLVRSFLYLEPAHALNEMTLVQISPCIGWIMSFARNLTVLETPSVLSYIFMGFALFSVLIAIGLLAQYIVLGLAKRGKRNADLKYVKKLIHPIALIRLAGVNAMMKIATILVVGLAMLGLTVLQTTDPWLAFFERIGINALALPLLFVIQIAGMLSLVEIAKKNQTIGTVFSRVTHLLRNQWLTAFEFALILFFIHFLASLGILALVVFTAVVSSALVAALLSTGSILSIALLTFSTLLFTAACIFIFAGVLTMFHYSAWTELSVYLHRSSHICVAQRFAQRILKRIW